MPNDKSKENTTDGESTTTATEDPPTTTETEENKADEAFVSFLKKHSLSGEKVLGILAEFGVNSLYDLKTTIADSDILGQVKEKLKGYPIVVKALAGLSVEAIDNAIFYSENPGAEAKAKALAEFLDENNVQPDDKGTDKLLSILRSSGVKFAGKPESAQGKGSERCQAEGADCENKELEPGGGLEFRIDNGGHGGPSAPGRHCGSQSRSQGIYRQEKVSGWNRKGINRFWHHDLGTAQGG
jgi:hypothetical protein